MRKLLVLRFRDLVIEPGGTINEHRQILEARGYVWWGWWMRQYEMPPDQLFAELYQSIEEGAEPDAFLFDSGRALLHPCRVSDIRTAPAGENIASPELESAPSYYERGAYPAWFKLTAISASGDTEVPEGWTFADFPSNPGNADNQALIGRPVESLESLRETDATLWVVEAP